MTRGQREEGSGPTERELGKRIAIEVRGTGSGCAGEKRRWVVLEQTHGEQKKRKAKKEILLLLLLLSKDGWLDR